MKRLHILLVFVLALVAMVEAQTVQYGIFASGTDLLVKAKPAGAYTTSDFLTDVVFTIRWQASYGVSLGSVSSTYSVAKTGAEGTSGSYKYQKFVLSGGSPITLPENWSAAGEYTMLTVPVGQTGVGTGTFELAPNGFVSGGNANIAINLSDVLNATTPFYQSSTSAPLPITLASFAAQMNPSGAGVRLDWRTLSEVNNYGFYVQRRMERDSLYSELANSFVAGHGTTVEPQQYSYVDNTVMKEGQYYYRLRQVDLDGAEHFTPGTGVVVAGLMSVKEVAPKEFKLHQNYPNPFNPSTELKFSVEATGRATLRVYSITGQEVATLFDGQAEAGQYYRVKVDGSSLASGIYFYRLESGKKSDLKKMILLK